MLKTALISIAAFATIPLASAAPAQHAKPVVKKAIIVPVKTVRTPPVVVVRSAVPVKRARHARVVYPPVRQTVAYRATNRAVVRHTSLTLRQLDLIEDVIDRAVDNGPRDRLEDRIDALNIRPGVRR
jgi:hypothetical protein